MESPGISPRPASPARGGPSPVPRRETAAGQIYVVDDDPRVRDSTLMLLKTAGHDALGYASGEAFLRHVDLNAGGCVILDLKLQGLDGLEVMRILDRMASPLSVIVLTGTGDVPNAVAALKGGASDFIEKPYDPDALLTAVEHALGADAAATSDAASEVAQRLVASLTRREGEVLKALLRGNSNKEIARELGLSPRTVEMHRSHMMERLGAASLADALRIAYDAGLAADRRSYSTEPLHGGRRASDR